MNDEDCNVNLHERKVVLIQPDECGPLLTPEANEAVKVLMHHHKENTMNTAELLSLKFRKVDTAVDTELIAAMNIPAGEYEAVWITGPGEDGALTLITHFHSDHDGSNTRLWTLRTRRLNEKALWPDVRPVFKAGKLQSFIPVR